MRTERVDPAADRRAALVPSRGREERRSDDTARDAEELPPGPGLAKENDPQKASERGARRDEGDDDARRPEREGRQIPDRGGRGREIGRAACRERGEISGGGGVVKKT